MALNPLRYVREQLFHLLPGLSEAKPYDRAYYAKKIGLPLEALPAAGETPTDEHRQQYMTLLGAGAHGDIRSLTHAKGMHEAFGDALLDQDFLWGVIVDAVVARRADAFSYLASFLPLQPFAEKFPEMLEFAARNGSAEMLEALYALKPDFNAPGFKSPFLGTLAKHQPELISTAIAHGADPNAIHPTHQQTALRHVVDSWSLTKTERKGIALLLDAGADPNCEGERASAIMKVAVAHQGDDDLFDALLAKTKDINARNAEGDTLLLFMLRHGEVRGLHKVFARRADVHAINHKGENAFHAVARSSTERFASTLKTLSMCGVAIDHRNKEDHTPLMIAVKLERYEMAAALIESGAKDLASAIGTLLESELDRAEPRKADARPKEREARDVLDQLLEAGARLDDHYVSGYTLIDAIGSAMQAGDFDGKEFARELAEYVQGWRDRLRKRHLQPADGAPLPLHRSDFTLKVMQRLRGAGIVHEAFVPAHWQGRVEEAHQLYHHILTQLPEAEARQFTERVDPVWMVTETHPLPSEFTARIQPRELGKKAR